MKATGTVQRKVVGIFFGLLLLAGLWLFRDYGISLDEREQRGLGLSIVQYIQDGDNRLLQFQCQDYGPFYKMLLALLERGLHLTDIQTVYWMRHLVTFLFFYLGVVFFYRLARVIVVSRWLALLGCLLLVFNPRIFADAFYNPKDIPTLTLYVICTYTLVRYLQKKNFRNTFVHALACAVLIDTRIVGFLFPALTLIFIAVDVFNRQDKKEDIRRILLSIIEYAVFLVAFIILFWPFLWGGPLQNFIYGLVATAHFQWGLSVLYWGQYIPAVDLPWHYLPVWMAISTPLAYLAVFAVGYARTWWRVGRDLAQFYRKNKAELVNFLLFTLPFLSVCLTQPTLYDGWRHFYFIYPAFLLIALSGLRWLASCGVNSCRAELFRWGLFLYLVWNIVAVMAFMIRNHPYQHLYFNSLAGRDMAQIKERFDLDYWGLSYTQALRYIAQHDRREIVKVYVNNWWFEQPFTEMLSADDRRRLVRVEKEEDAEYFVSNYRWHKDEYPYQDKFYAVLVDGTPIAVVYRLVPKG